MKPTLTTLPLLLLPLLLACDKDEVGDSQVQTQDITLRFTATVGGQALTCSDLYDVGTGSLQVQVADARMFISGVELQNADGDWVTMTLEQDGKWQAHDVTLLDFEDGSGACADSGTSDLNDQITGTLPQGEYSAVRFDVGIPSEHNHLDNGTAGAPFTAPGMFWSWQGGYKFLRVDFMVADVVPLRWNTHVGSTDCVSDSATTAPLEVCGKPNLSTVELTGFEGGAIAIDLASLVGGLDLSVNTPDTPPGCMSAPSEPDDCGPIWQSLGLSMTTGECENDCADQSVFSL